MLDVQSVPCPSVFFYDHLVDYYIEQNKNTPESLGLRVDLGEAFKYHYNILISQQD